MKLSDLTLGKEFEGEHDIYEISSNFSQEGKIYIELTKKEPYEANPI